MWLICVDIRHKPYIHVVLKKIYSRVGTRKLNQSVVEKTETLFLTALDKYSKVHRRVHINTQVKLS